MKFDARTQTEYGLLRSFFQINARAGRNDGGDVFAIDKAFIQFGGLTAGYAHTFFGIYDNEYGDTIFAPYYTSSSTVNLIAYTAVFGGGFTATLALEDGGEHAGTNWDDNEPGFPFSTGRNNTVTPYSGKRMPDVVAQLRVEQEWGKAAAFGAVHQVRYIYALPDDDWGWAAGGTVAINAPGIPGLYAVLEGVYAEGATDYLGARGTGAQDGAFFGGDTDTGRGWSLTGEIGYAISPQVTLVAFGSYLDYDNKDIGGVIEAPAEDDFKLWTVGANVTYTVVKDLTIGAEVSYTKQDFDHFEDTDGWQGGVRIKRTF